ncbi:ribbon-helix-helix domain-containing protein [Roseococcus suduntuyensis]|uniref:Antitoxin-like ribbon-helix-helix domain-containing protein n=1 Tax=Roseococcus suduntuyensis TaxID=455361 RepID=A0A840AHN1_9PROT|nr:ribbon-helix-helix domain-containing protein [Roseococcus suduntuyensis]MBB3900497.1 hypothetical protein [Roseococcus suduntuyensis]
MSADRKPPPPGGEEQPALPLPDPAPKSKRQRRGDNTRHRRGIASDGRIGQTLRLHPEAWEQLKILTAKERVNAHDLLVEAVNDLFVKHGYPPIA